MEDQAELIRQQMQEKRAELSDKLQSLGEILPSTETVTETVESVSETAAAVADNVQDTVKTVQAALDLPKHVQEHPWLAVGGAVIVGYLAHGYLTARRTTPDGKEESLFASQMQEVQQFAAQTAFDLLGKATSGVAAGEAGSLLSMLLGQFLNKSSEEPSKPREDKSCKSGTAARNGNARRSEMSNCN